MTTPELLAIRWKTVSYNFLKREKGVTYWPKFGRLLSDWSCNSRSLHLSLGVDDLQQELVSN